MKTKLLGALLAGMTVLSGCTIYLDIEESDKDDGPSDGPSDVTDDDWGCDGFTTCIDAGISPEAEWICPDGSWDCWFPDAGVGPRPDAAFTPDACPAGHNLPDGTWVCDDVPTIPPDAGVDCP
jgi:hypothetical protein